MCSVRHYLSREEGLMKPIVWIIADENGLPLYHEGRSPKPTEESDWASYMWFSFDTVTSFYQDYLKSEVDHISIQSPQYVVRVDSLGRNYILVAVYPKSFPLGMILLTHKKVLQSAKARIEEILSSQHHPEEVVPGEKKKMEKLLAFVQTRAPDPAFVVSRISLKTGIPPGRIMDGEVSSDEFQTIEQAVRDILGVHEIIY